VARIDYDDATGPLLQTSVSGTLEPVTAGSPAPGAVALPGHDASAWARIHWQALRCGSSACVSSASRRPPDQFVTR
jgi:DUF1365 family protein